MICPLKQLIHQTMICPLNQLIHQTMICPLKQLIHQTIDPSNNDLSSETIDPSNNESGSVLQTTDPDQSCKKINPDLFLAKMCGALTDKLNLHEIVPKILF